MTDLRHHLDAAFAALPLAAIRTGASMPQIMAALIDEAARRMAEADPEAAEQVLLTSPVLRCASEADAGTLRALRTAALRRLEAACGLPTDPRH